MADLDGTTFLNSGNIGFIADLYARFLDDPQTVDESWRAFFSDLEDDRSTILAELRAPTWNAHAHRPPANGAPAAQVVEDERLRHATSDSIRALQLIRAYRVRGHLEADLDPLGLEKRGPFPELDYRTYGFTETDL